MSGQLSNLFQCREQWISIELKPRGTDVTNMVVTGHADIGVLAVSEILVAGGVDYAGTLPSEDSVGPGVCGRDRGGLEVERAALLKSGLDTTAMN